MGGHVGRTSYNSTDSPHADATYELEKKNACWGAVCAGADRSLSSLSPTPTNRDFTKKKDKQTGNSARMRLIEGNNKNKFLPQVVHLWSLEPIQKKVSGCLFVR